MEEHKLILGVPAKPRSFLRLIQENGHTAECSNSVAFIIIHNNIFAPIQSLKKVLLR